MRTKDTLRTRDGLRLVSPASTAMEADPGAPVIALTSSFATDASVTGAKASALARAAAAGLEVLPGFVIPVGLSASIVAAGGIEDLPRETREGIRDAWRLMSHDATRKLVVRSSSTAEDGKTTSMAGMFTSVLDVDSWAQFTEAVQRVLESRKVIDLGRVVSEEAPIAVLVQPQLDAVRGGVMFGVDPVTGNPDHLTVVAVEGGPDALVSGRVEGEQYLLTHSGRLVKGSNRDASLLTPRDRRALARMARRAAGHFGGAQDIEWGIGHDGVLRLFQSRPVTAVGAQGSGPILGPGPVAETFPDALTILEIDLWITPLREAIIEALALTGTASRRQIARSPVVTTIAGQVAADLELFGIAPVRKSLWAKLDPIPPARRMAAAWRVGRLRAALPLIATAITTKTDRNLEHVPDLQELTNEQLVILLKRAQQTLKSLHGFEVLAGLLDDTGTETATGAAVALRALAVGRSEGFKSSQIVVDSPEVLALVPPTIASTSELPSATTTALDCDAPDRHLGPREALRLRIRWVQELSARAAWELGRRMVPAKKLNSPQDIVNLTMDELEDMTANGRVPRDLQTRGSGPHAPLPSAFKLSPGGAPVPVAMGTSGDRARGGGGGRGMGRVHHGTTPEHGEVLVVRTLDPNLAPLLPTLAGLVAETGSALSHLAILAREFGVPVVVAYEGALDRFPQGTVVVVDGSTGEVTEVAET